MEHAIDKLQTDIERSLTQLTERRKAFSESMENDEILASTKLILKEIKELEATISGIAGNC